MATQAPPSAATVIRHSVLASLGMIVLYFAVPVRADEGAAATTIRSILTLAALVAVALSLKRQLVRHLTRADAPLGGLVVGILAGLLLFALLDYMIAANAPGQFAGLATRIDALYFALSTLLTVGFGDVHAHGQLARAVVTIQMLYNVIVLATTASLVARQIGARARTRQHR